MKVAGPPRAGVPPAARDSHLGRTLSRSLDPSKLRGAPPAGLPGESRGTGRAGLGSRLRPPTREGSRKLWRTCLPPADPRNSGEPAWGLPRPASRAHPRGRGRWRRAADRQQWPGQLALWAKGARRRAPGWPPPPLGEAARRACRAAYAVLVLGSAPLCCAGCARLRRWRWGGPAPALAGRRLRQPIARPCRLHSIPPPSAAWLREGRRPRDGGGDRWSTVWSACSRAGAGRTWAGQCGDPQTTGDPVHASEAPGLKGTSAHLFFLPCPEGSTKVNTDSPYHQLCGVSPLAPQTHIGSLLPGCGCTPTTPTTPTIHLRTVVQKPALAWGGGGNQEGGF